MYDTKNKKKSHVQILNPNKVPRTEAERDKAVIGAIMSCLYSFKQSREPLERIWMESWAAYFGSPEALEYQRTMVADVVGNVSDDWRHRINVGKAFEIVETVVSYLAAAIFPNKDWMKIEPTEPIVMQTARILTRYFSTKLVDWKFKTNFIASIRQAAITGSTTFACPWVDGQIKFETLDNFDVYYDPTAQSSDESPIIRRLIMTRAEVITNINSGKYKNIKAEDVTEIKGDCVFSDDSDQVKRFQGLDPDATFSYDDKIECWEYWGDIYLEGICYHQHYALIIGEHLVNFQPSPYDCGRPLTCGTYTPVVRQPHGMSAYQPVLGLLHVLNSATNQRMDNVELSTNAMYLRKQSSITPAEEIFSEPGKVIDVLEMDEVQQMPQNPNNLLITYQEVSTIQSAIEQVTGTGPLVSTSQPRGGERVTAQEVAMVREAGSNRLSIVHNHLEDTFLIPVLEKVLLIVKQFMSKDEIVRIAGKAKDANEYYMVGKQELKDAHIKLKPRGADHIIEQKEYIERRTAFIQLVLSVPQFAEKVDFEKILIDLMENWGFEEPQSYLVSQETEPGMPAGDPMSALEQMGGKGLQNAANVELAVDGGESALQQIAGQGNIPQGLNFDDILSQLTGTGGLPAGANPIQ